MAPTATNARAIANVQILRRLVRSHFIALLRSSRPDVQFCSIGSRRDSIRLHPVERFPFHPLLAPPADIFRAAPESTGIAKCEMRTGQGLRRVVLCAKRLAAHPRILLW